MVNKYSISHDVRSALDPPKEIGKTATQEGVKWRLIGRIPKSFRQVSSLSRWHLMWRRGRSKNKIEVQPHLFVLAFLVETMWAVDGM